MAFRMLAEIPGLGGLDTTDPGAPWDYLNSIRSTPRSPERRLLIAILIDAVETVRNRKPHRQSLRRDAQRWFRSNDDNGVFTFVNICRCLDIDPTAVRRKLKNDLKKGE